MAEFLDVMKQVERMCKAQEDCDECPVCNALDCVCVIADLIELDLEKMENIVMRWSAENPEPRYPSWNEAWKQLMPNAHNEKSPCPCFFLDTDRAMKLCNEQECVACKNTPIPADIAETLGIKPIGGQDA